MPPPARRSTPSNPAPAQCSPRSPTAASPTSSAPPPRPAPPLRRGRGASSPRRAARPCCCASPIWSKRTPRSSPFSMRSTPASRSATASRSTCPTSSHAALVRREPRQVLRQGRPHRPENLALIVREPIGVVGAVLPWNFPTSTGCLEARPRPGRRQLVVVKPAEQAPLSPSAWRELAAEAGLPDGVFNVVPGPRRGRRRALGLSHATSTPSPSPARPRSDATSCATPPTATSSASCSNAAARVRRSSWPTPPRPRLRRRAGRQRRLLEHWAELHRRLADPRRAHDQRRGRRGRSRSTKRLARSATRSTRPPELGADHRARGRCERILRYIDEAGERRRAARLRRPAHPRRIPAAASCSRPSSTASPPTWRSPAKRSSARSCRCISFADEDEAIALANDTDYGLAASVFTHDLDRAHRMARARTRRHRVGQLLLRGRHHDALRRLQDLGLRRPRQGHRGARPVQRAQDDLVRAQVGAGPRPDLAVRRGSAAPSGDGAAPSCSRSMRTAHTLNSAVLVTGS